MKNYFAIHHPHWKGNLYIGPRPSHKELARHIIPADVVVTLLTDQENAQLLGTYAEMGGYRWEHRPLSGVRGIEWDVDEYILGIAQDIRDMLIAGQDVYIHCAAGVHRTGTVAINILRLEGVLYLDAVNILISVRPKVVTFRELLE